MRVRRGLGKGGWMVCKRGFSIISFMSSSEHSTVKNMGVPRVTALQLHLSLTLPAVRSTSVVSVESR